MSASETDSARPRRRISRSADNRRGLFRRVHKRRNDPLRAEVEHPLDHPVFGGGNTNHARGAVSDRLQDAQDIPHLERAVLAVDEQPIKPDLGENL